jgi:hypothetical protein
MRPSARTAAGRGGSQRTISAVGGERGPAACGSHTSPGGAPAQGFRACRSPRRGSVRRSGNSGSSTPADLGSSKFDFSARNSVPHHIPKANGRLLGAPVERPFRQLVTVRRCLEVQRNRVSGSPYCLHCARPVDASLERKKMVVPGVRSAGSGMTRAKTPPPINRVGVSKALISPTASNTLGRTHSEAKQGVRSRQRLQNRCHLTPARKKACTNCRWNTETKSEAGRSP